MKLKQRVPGMLILLLIIPLLAWPARAASPSIEPQEVVLYAMDDWAAKHVTIPSSYAQEYQIQVENARQITYELIEGKSVTVSDTGLVKPNIVTLYWYRDGYVIYRTTVERPDQEYYKITRETEFGTSTIRVTADNVVFEVSVEVLDYVETYADMVIDEYIRDNFYEGMTVEEQMDSICRFPASYNYSTSYSSHQGMIVSGGGDCWASTSLILEVCDRLGLDARQRNGNRDSAASSGHCNALVIMGDGDYYELDAGYVGSAPRKHTVLHRTSLLSYRNTTGGIEVYQYDGDIDFGTVLEVPQTIDGKTVVSIGGSFVSMTYVKEVVLPETITKIKASAFNSCSKLETLHIPASVTEIGEYAFTGCVSLNNFTCSSDNLTFCIRDNVLYNKNCTTILAAPSCTAITIPETVETIGTYAFYYNSNLQEVCIPKTVKTLEEGAFGDCRSLKRVLVEGEPTIGAYAFARCYNLSGLGFQGDGVAIEDYAFYSVKATVCYPENNSSWTSEILQNYQGTLTWVEGHTYETVTVPSTCVQEGSQLDTCTVCGTVETTPLPLADHNDEVVDHPPTCTTPGYKVYTCLDCGRVVNGHYACATGHSYQVTQIFATCTSGGYLLETCRNCDYRATFAHTGPLEHSFTVTTVKSTCTTRGYLLKTCQNCDYRDTFAYTDIVDHTYRVTPVEATCTTGSYLIYACENCDYSYTCAHLQPPGHSEVTIAGVAPGCTVPGLTEGKCCETCQEVLVAQKIIPATGHSFTEGVCTVCGEGKAVVTPVIRLRYPTVSFEDEIRMNVYFSAAQLEDVVDMGLITYKDRVSDWSVENARQVLPGYALSEDGDLYYVRTAGIAAKDFGDEIHFAVYARLTDGSYWYSNLITYSPKTYAYALLSTGTPEMKSLVVAMLNYGAAAQAYFGYKTDAPVNEGLSSEHRGLVEEYRSDMITAVTAAPAQKQGTLAGNGGYTKGYPTVTFTGAFSIQFYCVPSAEPVDGVTMYYWSEEDYNANTVLTTQNATAAIAMTVDDDGRYHAAVEGIAAKNLDQGSYICFSYSDGTTTYNSGVVAYSIGNYCSAQAGNSGSTAALARATAVYGYYAGKCFPG